MTTPTPSQVAELRDEFGLTAEEFGALVYAEPATVYAWEKGRRTCSPTSWELLRVYFGKQAPRTLKPASTSRTVTAQARKLERAVQTIQKAAASLSTPRQQLEEAIRMERAAGNHKAAARIATQLQALNKTEGTPS